MENYEGTCGRYIWSPGTGAQEWIDPNSYEPFVKQHSLGSIYHCLADDGDFLAIQSCRSETYRVNRQGFDQVQFTPFYTGDRVRILTGSQAGKEAIIWGMGWHMNKKQVIYILEINGKRRSRQYWENDIEAYEQLS